jgi:hypothetical protein
MQKLLLPAFVATLILAAPAARAFTFENNSPSTGNGTAIVDPDEQIKGSGTGSTTARDGGLKFHFGPSTGSSSQPSSPPIWSRDPLFLDKGSSQRDQ